MLEYLLGPSRIEARGIFAGAFVKRLLDENSQGRADHTYLIYALLTLEIWMQTFIDNAGEEISL